MVYLIVIYLEKDQKKMREHDLEVDFDHFTAHG
jgi:hypothetical protein